MTRSLLPIVLVAAVLAVPSVAGAGPGRARQQAAQKDKEPAGGRGAGRGPRGLSPVDVLNVLDGYAIMQAQEFLKLSDSQYGDFVLRLKRLQDTRRRNLRERNQILQSIRALVGQQATATPDDATVRDKLKALRDLDDRSAVEMRKAYDALDEVMDVKQQGRFRLFEETLERRRIELLSRAAQAAAKQEPGRH